MLADVDHVTTVLRLPHKDVDTGFGTTAADLPTSSRHYLAMRRLLSDHNLDGLAIRCWPELPGGQGVGQWSYMALARLATEGVPVACEGDVDGALGCLVNQTVIAVDVYGRGC